MVSNLSVQKHLEAAKVKSLADIGQLSHDGLSSLAKRLQSAAPGLAPKQRRALADMLARAENFKRVRSPPLFSSR